MERLDFQIPEFVRILWVSPQAQEVWEPRIQRVSNMWNLLERHAVRARIKPACLQICSPVELLSTSEWAVREGLICLPLEQQRAVTSYGNATEAVVEGQPWSYKIVIAKDSVAAGFVRAWKTRKNSLIGDLLGFPTCCRDFFERYWVEEGWRDLTYPMSLSKITTDGPAECNILLRWLGVRLVSHLPCSFQCVETRLIGEKMRGLAFQMSFDEELKWLNEMLAWPVRWSSLHGIATITTPVLRIITSSDALPEKAVVDKIGCSYPAEGARGTEFPFRLVQQVTVRRTNDYAANGFSSKEAMDKAHAVILKAVNLGLPLGKVRRVIDLGCGNARLLQKIHAAEPMVIPFGVESDGDRCEEARRLIAPVDAGIYCSDLRANSYWIPYDLALISVNRLKELGVDEAWKLLVQLKENCKRVIFYSYETDEWPGIGIDNASTLFEIDAHFSGRETGTKTCAILTTSKKETNE